jgi:single-strand DNA-binding protein
LKRGSLVLVEGRIKTRNWVDKSGAKQYRTEIIAETMQLGPRGAGATAGASAESTGYSGKSTFNSNAPAQKMEEIPVIEENYPAPSNEVSLDSNDSGEIDIKDIPF